jgi:hypothetical protein
MKEKFTAEQNKKMAEIARISFSMIAAKEAAKKSNLQQKRTAEIWKIQQERIDRNYVSVKASLKSRLENMYLSHVSMGCTGREEHRTANSNYSVDVIRSGKGILALVKLDGWVQYSRATGYYVHRAWLVGKDVDSGWFDIQVSSKCETVEEALDFIKPAAVKKAERENRAVFRQGDIYFVEMKKKCTIGEIPSGHYPSKNSFGWSIEHKEHGILCLPGFNWKAHVQKSVHGRVAD